MSKYHYEKKEVYVVYAWYEEENEELNAPSEDLFLTLDEAKREKEKLEASEEFECVEIEKEMRKILLRKGGN